MTQFPPGWYPDPDDMASRRYWDGQQWGPSLSFAPAPALAAAAYAPSTSGGRHAAPVQETYEPTYAPPMPYGAPPQEGPRHRKLLIGSIAVVVVAAVVALVLTLAGGGGKQDEVRGTFELTDTSGFTGNGDEGSSCAGTDGYDDIDAGAQVIISDDSGKTLSITELGPGQVNAASACEFDFSTSVPAGRKYYGVEITHRGVVKEQESDLGDLSLTLG